MDSDDELIQPRRRKWIPITALTAGTVLIAAPLVFLWGIRKHQRSSLNPAKLAPPRRVGSFSSSALVTSAPASRLTFSASEASLQTETLPPPPPQAYGSDWDDDNWGVPPQPPDPNDNFNVGLYLLKALGTATLIVSSVTFVGIWGLRRYLDVDNVDDFALKMRLCIINKMPVLASRMRNALGGLPEPVSDRVDEKLPPEQRWTLDEAQERLSNAFDKGGLSAWAEVAAQEVEQEARLELEKRDQMKSVSSSKTS
ncbi:hypothetical protein C8R45DRAFT_581738 [Mycena sanguinolenta]|nr:hypothetical protein C8R45DRAFT_581738 [Mycena sanguinolenta]